MMMGRVPPVLAFRFFGKDLSSQPATQTQPRPPRLFPPFTRQLSTPRTAKMLFSVSRASVRRLPDEPGDGRPPVRDGVLLPRAAAKWFFRAGPLTPAFYRAARPSPQSPDLLAATPFR